MKLTLEEMREIAKRIPIGYYLGRKVPVTIEPSGGAYCDVIKGNIHIGLPLLQYAVDHVDAAEAEKWDRETLLRCLLYHEVGHLLLTSSNLAGVMVYVRGTYSSVSKAFVNIFEDERLERILSRFFMGVDFKAFCKLVNKGDESEEDTDIKKFFSAVRLRRTTPEISAAVDDAIARTKSFNAATKYGFDIYQGVLQQLVNKILTEEDAKPKESGGSEGESSGEPDGSKGGSGKSDGESGEGEGDKSDDSGGGGKSGGKPEGDKSEKEGEDRKEGGESGEDGDKDDGGKGDGDGESGDKGDRTGAVKDKSLSHGGECAPSDDSPSRTGKSDADEGEVAPRELDLPDDFLKMTAKTVFVEPTSEVTNTLNRFATRLSKRKGAQAAGCWSGLHGRIDTRRDALDKDRIFRRRSDVGDSLMSSVNLTLWVDVSGSFRRSGPVLNKILTATASALAMAGKRLSVNVVKMGDYARVAPSDHWYVNPNEGNCINRSYYESWKKTRCKDRRNIDIVVFDGDAKSDDYRKSEKMPDGRWIEKVIWDHPDCHIISDPYNEKYFDKLGSAHITYIEGRYAEQLQKEVLKTLDRIL